MSSAVCSKIVLLCFVWLSEHNNGYLRIQQKTDGVFIIMVPTNAHKYIKKLCIYTATYEFFRKFLYPNFLMSKRNNR